MATHGGHRTHRNRWQPRSAVILSVDTDGGQTSEWSCVHQQPRLRWHLVLVFTINQQQPAPGSRGGEAAPTPIPDRGPDRGWAQHQPLRSREARLRFVLLQTSPLSTPRPTTTISRYYLIFIFTYLHMYICKLYIYLQKCVKG